jgi:putative ABC transport system permease protein
MLWVLIVTILAALASFIPAYRAARMSVHEVLAYE